MTVAIMNIHISEGATGVIERSFNPGLKAFPNPFSEKISSALSDRTDRFLSIAIYDLNGRLMERLNNHFDDLDMKKEESGPYFYSADTEKGRSYRGKIFKE